MKTKKNIIARLPSHKWPFISIISSHHSYNKRVTVSIFWWENSDHQHILGFSHRRERRSSFFSLIVLMWKIGIWCVGLNILTIKDKMCESNQVQFNMLCPVYSYSNTKDFNVDHFIEKNQIAKDYSTEILFYLE